MYKDGECHRHSSIRVHVYLRVSVKDKFIEHWEDSSRLPEIAKIFLITWDEEMRSSFDDYRYVVFLIRFILVSSCKGIVADDPGSTLYDRTQVAYVRGMSTDKAEVKRFRAEQRACLLGEPGCEKLCDLPDGYCRLCTTVRTGFVYSLHFKRQFVLQGIE